MGEIVNLRLARKRKQRAEREASAEQNRSLHGRTKAERLIEDATRERATSQHEGHRREKPEDTDSEA